MKTSFPDIVETERYLNHELASEDSLVYQAKLVLDPQLRLNTFCHRMVHRLVRIYHRKKLKEEMEAVHDRLFNDPAKEAFSRRIMNLFNS